MAETDDTKITPPYGSFSTFWNYVGNLKAEQLPPQLDRSMMRGKSGSDQAVIISALKFFGLIDTERNNEVQPLLKQLVAAQGDDRKAVVGGLVRSAYFKQLEVSVLPGTEKQLHDSFEAAFGVTGETRRKAATFFLHAATAAGIAVSPHFPKVRSGQGRTAVSPVKKVAKKAATKRAPFNNPKDGGTGDNYSIDLVSGGTVQLIVSADLMALLRHDTDRKFVTELIDKMESYASETVEIDDNSEEDDE